MIDILEADNKPLAKLVLDHYEEAKRLIQENGTRGFAGDEKRLFITGTDYFEVVGNDIYLSYTIRTGLDDSQMFVKKIKPYSLYLMNSLQPKGDRQDD